MRSVLVGSDLGPGSDAVVRGAAALALGSGATLHVVHALGLIGLPLREAVTSLQGGVVEQARHTLREQVRRVLAGCADVVVPVVDYQSPPLAILERAKSLEADLVVLGAAWGSAPGEHLSGSTVRVLAQGDLPVLVLREPFRWAPRSVLVPVDGEPGPGDPLRHARDWLRRACPGTAGTEPRLESRVLHPAGAEGGGAPSPAEQILGWAERDAADLILMHRRDDDSVPLPERTWYQVLRRAPCAVCLLPETRNPPARPLCAVADGAPAPEDEAVLALRA